MFAKRILESKKYFLIPLIMLHLAGCATDPNRENPGPPPSNYKQIVKSYIQQNFFDPYSLRDVAINAPVEGQIWFVHGWLVCLQVNAKNRMGGYIGLNKTAYLIRNGLIVDQLANAPVCDTLPLVPWPEMENGGNGSKSGGTK